MEKEKIVPDSDCNPREKTSHDFWVRSQSTVNKKYLVTCHRTNFITCDYLRSIHGNICKHAIKVGWLCSGSMASNQLQNHKSTTESNNDPPEINIEAIFDLPEDENIISMDSHNVDVNVEGIELRSYLAI